MQVDEEMKKATGIHDQQYINQFPYEACLVMKHHLAETIQKVHSMVIIICHGNKFIIDFLHYDYFSGHS